MASTMVMQKRRNYMKICENCWKKWEIINCVITALEILVIKILKNEENMRNL